MRGAGHCACHIQLCMTWTPVCDVGSLQGRCRWVERWRVTRWVKSWQLDARPELLHERLQLLDPPNGQGLFCTLLRHLGREQSRWVGLTQPLHVANRHHLELAWACRRSAWRMLWRLGQRIDPARPHLPPTTPSGRLDGRPVENADHHTCMYVCTYVRTYVCTYVHMYVCIYVCMSLRVYVFMMCYAKKKHS